MGTRAKHSIADQGRLVMVAANALTAIEFHFKAIHEARERLMCSQQYLSQLLDLGGDDFTVLTPLMRYRVKLVLRQVIEANNAADAAVVMLNTPLIEMPPVSLGRISEPPEISKESS